MSDDAASKINHRELIRSASKRYRCGFQRLPHDLQDEIIAGLDQNTLTYDAASALIKVRGGRLSYQAVSNYYRAVRRERQTRLGA
jgi:hypothetical protein